VIRDDELERILASEERLIPDQGFTASVMAAAAREASSPPPIPFPWIRALSGLAACAAALAAAVWAGALRTEGIADLGLRGLMPALAVGLGPETLGWLWLAGVAVLATLATGVGVSWLVRERLEAIPH
jgi:hypothetical protein